MSMSPSTEPTSPDEDCGQLAAITGMSVKEWQDFMSLEPEQQCVVAQGYKNMVWVQDSNTLATVLNIIGLIIPIVGAISGAAGAATAIKALV